MKALEYILLFVIPALVAFVVMSVLGRHFGWDGRWLWGY